VTTDRVFHATANEPALFPLYLSSTRSDRAGDVVPLGRVAPARRPPARRRDAQVRQEARRAQGAGAPRRRTDRGRHPQDGAQGARDGAPLRP
jgi:hypothetical protein